MVNSEKFAERLQKIMDEYDLNATSFADAIDVGRSSISHIISGRNKPSLEFVMKIIDAFPEVELYWLLNGKGSFPKRTTAETKVSPVKQNYELDFDRSSSEPPQVSGSASEQYDERTEGSPIERIVIFYKDGTFKSFRP
ncbi:MULTISPECIES: helix-turn-helix transcriptional regulator [unclassified Leeuwenhoekiella]|uniref:helix-turn-helix domain-containing protein n=1 Tax=unclassified Leeuwenhoekiella TaxID=2615029 RepID=UPI000C3651CF|nr:MULTISPECIES: helix-turn-helix transcriptional regulator [unclassified Leeuwenhoekiella]MAW95251.1 transcriptional regulator [Leeuwenhoekiella sp.]MBA81826.1 transcriptional regulator [Leeuwenhoekiella sp.]|tara:strand:+ start:9232 stop:9648 length:417 start_codon:yes stop_codon:yes gene_type:complete